MPKPLGHAAARAERRRFQAIALLDRALELLDGEASWDASPPSGAECPAVAPLSLRCALIAAARQLELGEPTWVPGLWEVGTLVTHRLGDRKIYSAALLRYNDADGRTFEEVRAVLEGARRNIAAVLSR